MIAMSAKFYFSRYPEYLSDDNNEIRQEELLQDDDNEHEYLEGNSITEIGLLHNYRQN